MAKLLPFLPGLLTCVFILLKLCKVIAWSWIWVLAPFWAGFALAFIFMIVTVLYYDIKEKFRRK